MRLNTSVYCATDPCCCCCCSCCCFWCFWVVVVVVVFVVVAAVAADVVVAVVAVADVVVVDVTAIVGSLLSTPPARYTTTPEASRRLFTVCPQGPRFSRRVVFSQRAVTMLHDVEHNVIFRLS